MTPYYQDGLVTIYHGDCREWMPEADVIVTDPPYGTAAYEWDTLPTLPAGVYRHGAAFGRLPEMLPLLSPAPALVVTWWPSNGAAIGRSRVGVHRQAHVIAFWEPEGELRNPKASPTSIRLGWEKPGLMADVWTDAHPHAGFVKSEYSHPTEKPVGLMVKVLRLTGGGSVLDPFMGSGSTLVAAKSLGRKSIGIEIEERYCEMAATRCSQEVLGLVG